LAALPHQAKGQPSNQPLGAVRAACRRRPPSLPMAREHIDGQDANAQVPSIAMHCFRYLHGQLTRGNEHQGHWVGTPGFPGEALQNRERERPVFPVPVAACPTRSRPCSRDGIALR